MNNFVAQGIRYGEGSAIDHRSWRSRNDGADMTGGAANFLKQLCACLGCGGCSQNRIAWGRFRTADELSEVVDVCQTKIVGNIFGVAGNFADGGHILGPQTVRYSHFIQISVPDEGKQATVLIFPAEAANARL